MLPVKSEAVDDAPQLLYYRLVTPPKLATNQCRRIWVAGTRHCSDLEVRSHFLFALGGAIRAAEEGSGAVCQTPSEATVEPLNLRQGSAVSNLATRLRILAGRVAGTALEVDVVYCTVVPQPF